MALKTPSDTGIVVLLSGFPEKQETGTLKRYPQPFENDSTLNLKP